MRLYGFILFMLFILNSNKPLSAMSSTLNNIEFLSPRLVGERFLGHAIPLEVLRDLAVLEEMLVETAKWGYMQEHPDRKRIPRGFTNGVSLKLTGILSEPFILNPIAPRV